MAKKERVIVVEPPALFSYQMPKAMADGILYDVDRSKVDVKKVLVDWVNKNCGLLYPCNEVVVN